MTEIAKSQPETPSGFAKSQPKPVRCGCGGEAKVISYLSKDYYTMAYYVRCVECGIETDDLFSESEAIEAWNRAMGSTEKSSTVERTAKVIDKSLRRRSISDFDWIGKCEKCGNAIQFSFEYCPSCGCRLEWE